MFAGLVRFGHRERTKISFTKNTVGIEKKDKLWLHRETKTSYSNVSELLDFLRTVFQAFLSLKFIQFVHCS